MLHQEFLNRSALQPPRGGRRSPSVAGSHDRDVGAGGVEFGGAVVRRGLTKCLSNLCDERIMKGARAVREVLKSEGSM